MHVFSCWVGQGGVCGEQGVANLALRRRDWGWEAFGRVLTNLQDEFKFAFVGGACQLIFWVLGFGEAAGGWWLVASKSVPAKDVLVGGQQE